HAVIAPVARARELADRHELDPRHPDVAQLWQFGRDAVERPRVSERPDVQLVEHEIAARRRAPVTVAPLEAPRVDGARRPVDAVRLRPARWIRTLDAARSVGEDVQVLGARGHPGDVGLEHAAAASRERPLARARASQDAHLHALGTRRPGAEADAAEGRGRASPGVHGDASYGSEGRSATGPSARPLPERETHPERTPDARAIDDQRLGVFGAMSGYADTVAG